MNISEKQLIKIIRESLKTNLKATTGVAKSTSTPRRSGPGGTRQNVVVRYDAAAVQRAIQAGLSRSEAGSPDNTWQFKFTGSGNSRVWHASRDGSSWRNIGSDPDNSTIKRLNAAFPEASQDTSTGNDGDAAAANVATPD